MKTQVLAPTKVFCEFHCLHRSFERQVRKMILANLPAPPSLSQKVMKRTNKLGNMLEIRLDEMDRLNLFVPLASSDFSTFPKPEKGSLLLGKHELQKAAPIPVSRWLSHDEIIADLH